MKSGPTLKGWTLSFRQRSAANSPRVTVVLPTPLWVPAITKAENERDIGRYKFCGQRRTVMFACSSAFLPQGKDHVEERFRCAAHASQSSSRILRCDFP